MKKLLVVLALFCLASCVDEEALIEKTSIVKEPPRRVVKTPPSADSPVKS